MKEKILLIICDVYHKKYIGSLIVKHLKPIGYEVILGLNQSERPIHIAAELEEEAFLKFFREEIRSRHLNDISYFIGYQMYPDYTELEPPSDQKKIEIKNN